MKSKNSSSAGVTNILTGLFFNNKVYYVSMSHRTRLSPWLHAILSDLLSTTIYMTRAYLFQSDPKKFGVINPVDGQNGRWKDNVSVARLRLAAFRREF